MRKRKGERRKKEENVRKRKGERRIGRGEFEEEERTEEDRKRRV